MVNTNDTNVDKPTQEELSRLTSPETHATSREYQNMTSKHKAFSYSFIPLFTPNGSTSNSKSKAAHFSSSRQRMCLSIFFGSKIRKCYFKIACVTVCLTLCFLSSFDGALNIPHLSNSTFSLKSLGVRRHPSFATKEATTTEATSIRGDRFEDFEASGFLGNVTEFQSDYSKGSKHFPNCIIFGVSKCGTRALLEYLMLHPDVVAPSDEVNFFGNKTLQEKGMNWYIQQMPFARSHQITVVKSPDYFQNHVCADLIYATNRSTKLLLLLRDPVERLVSQYMQLSEKHDGLPEFEEWVINPVTRSVNTKLPSVMVSAYSEHLSHWLDVFPKNQIHIIESNSLRENPFNEMKAVEKFLKLKSFYTSADFYFNASRKFYCTRVRSTGKTKCLGRSKGREHIPVDETVLDMLYRFYKPYNEKLNQILGMKFPWS